MFKLINPEELKSMKLLELIHQTDMLSEMSTHTANGIIHLNLRFLRIELAQRLLDGAQGLSC